MIESNRRRRAAIRELRRGNRARARAVKAVATGTAQTMGTHLLALGVPRKLAKSYAGTVSKNVPVHADQVTVTRKLKGRRRGTFTAFTYTRRQVARALATYVTKGGPRRASDRAAFTAAAVSA